MDKRTSMIVTIIGSIWLTSVTSCEKVELTRSLETNDYVTETENSAITVDSTNIDDKSGISFNLESDSLAEQIEDIQFQAQEWEEEPINADL